MLRYKFLCERRWGVWPALGMGMQICVIGKGGRAILSCSDEGQTRQVVSTVGKVSLAKRQRD